MTELLERPQPHVNLQRALGRSPIAAVLGPRQCGKTTLARQFAAQAQQSTWFDLENPVDVARLQEPMLVLERLRGLVVIDEVQRLPALFPLLRVLVDRDPLPARFLLLGSAAPSLMAQASETLAGRVAFVDLTGFTSDEVGDAHSLWLRGGFPRSYLAADEQQSYVWRQDFLRTFLEVDLALLGSRANPLTMRRLWTMLAHYHGQTWNGSELGRALGVSHHTVRAYLDVLTATFMVRQLQPWFENVGKRLVKAPKIYLRDSGLLHALLGLDTQVALEGHPKVGASWEGFALEQTLQALDGDPYVWSPAAGGEVDLLLQRRAQRWGFEFKRADAPRLQRSMQVGCDDLRLDHLWVVYPGSVRYPLAERITVLPLHEIKDLREG